LIASDWPDVTLSDNTVVINGNILMSKGAGTAMDLALAIIEHLTDKTTRNTVEADLVRTVCLS
jgi:4-methyl-5(b-hydroxyethyl)-thiazole monophosphate biosynthesis